MGTHKNSLFVIGLAGSLILVAGCGSSTSTSAAKPSTKATAVVPAAVNSAPPSVGPTNPTQSPAPKPVTIDLLVVKRDGAALVIAPVVVHGKTYAFIVDTGAEATLVSTTYAKELGLMKTGQAPLHVRGITGSGTAYLANISKWKIGSANIPTSTITVSTLNLGNGIVGLLGSDVLSTFGKITIDYSAQKASLG